MKYIELSNENVNEKSKELLELIKKDKIEYDIVVFVAKGAYTIGEYISKSLNIPLLEIKAERKGGRFKKMLKPIFRFIPKKVLIKLRSKEMKSDYHEKNNEREIVYDIKKYEKYKSSKNILLVDDSIDSGYTIIKAKEALKDYFKKNKNVKIAVFNYMSKSTVKPDYTLYTDVMICGPWSNDSKYNKDFCKLYKEWKNK